MSRKHKGFNQKFVVTAKKDNIHGRRKIVTGGFLNFMAIDNGKNVTRRVVTAGGWQLAKRLSRSIPLAGTAIVVGLAGNTIRKKGMIRGTLDVGLDLIPVVGTAKTVIEIFTGDLIPDKDSLQKNGQKSRDDNR